MALKFGLFVPPFGSLAEPGRLVELARAADGSGWDGFFLWDHILALPGMAVADPWVTMAALAQSTTRLRLGTLVTPLARRRPWVLARQAATLDWWLESFGPDDPWVRALEDAARSGPPRAGAAGG